MRVLLGDWKAPMDRMPPSLLPSAHICCTRRCPTFLDNCYSISASTANFAAAQTACRTIGGALVSWNSKLEQLQVGCVG